MDSFVPIAELCEEATDELDDRLCADEDTLVCDDDSEDEDLLEEIDDEITDEETDETTEEEIADDDDLTEEEDTAGAELDVGGVSWESDPPPHAESTAAKLHAISKLKLCFI